MTIKTIGALFAPAAFLGLLLAAPQTARAQDKPTPITGKLPARAECVVCSAGGEAHGEERAAAGVMYKGKAYYFCNKKEVAVFTKDPEAYLPAVLPRRAPASALKTLNGQATNLASLNSKVLLVDFWATWCAPCVKAMPDLQKLHEQYRGKGFSVVGVSIDEKGAQVVQPFLAKRKFTYPMLLDQGDVWQQWGVKALPGVFLVKDGQIVRQWTGKIDKKEVDTAVKKALEDR